MFLYRFGPNINPLPFISLLKDNVFKEIMLYRRLLVDDLLKKYTKEDIENIIDKGLCIVGNSIWMITSGQEGQFLRAIEYGTGNSKAYHIVTNALRKTLKEVL